MKIEVLVHHVSGDVKSYLVHKLVRHGNLYTAHYSTVKAGFRVCRKVIIDNVTAELKITR